MDGTTTKSMYQFQELPDQIKTWISSSSLTFIIESLNNKLGFKDEEKIRLIPLTTLRLVLGDIAPQDFINELASKLAISFSSAKALAHEIEEKLLKPIEIPLRTELGIDITIIHLAELSVRDTSQAPASLTAPSAPIPTYMPPTAPVLPPIGEKQWRKVESSTPIETTVGRSGPAVAIKPIKPEEEPKPFILHEEVVPFSATVPPVIKTIKPKVKEIPKPESIKTAPTPKTPEVRIASPISRPTPPALKMEAPLLPTPPKPVDKKSVSSVIHYSNFKTSLDENLKPKT